MLQKNPESMLTTAALLTLTMAIHHTKNNVNILSLLMNANFQQERYQR